MEDSIRWLIYETDTEKLCYYLTSPYINQDADNYYAKLIYTTSKPFQNGNICKIRNGELWYKTIHKIGESKKISIEDSEIQIISNCYGVENGNGYTSHLTKVPKLKIKQVFEPPFVQNIYLQDSLKDLLCRIAEFYNIQVNDILLTGSGGFFHESLYELNDLDIIVPIDSIEQLKKISCQKIPKDSNPIKLKEKNWPLRWSKELDLIICPFFIYRNLNIPIKKLYPTNFKIKGEIKITNTSYGIFNLPVFECTGIVKKIIVNSTFIRGLLEIGMVLYIEASIYEILDGEWIGETVAIINNDIVSTLKKSLYFK